MLNLVNFMHDCERQASKEVKGCRNQRVQAVAVAKRTVPKRYTKRLKTASAVVRIVGKELGTKKWSDRRYVLDYVKIAKITDKMIVGTCGERVPFDTIIAWGR